MEIRKTFESFFGLITKENKMTEKEKALVALKQRQDNPPKKINNWSLHAGSPMYFYCKLCDGDHPIVSTLRAVELLLQKEC